MLRSIVSLFTVTCFISFPLLASPVHLDGASLSLYWALPFVGMLLSIALLPLLTPVFWHHHFGKVAAAWALSFCLPFSVFYGVQLTLYEVLHIILKDYIPFLAILIALYTVSSGIHIKGSMRGTPLFNTSLLALGSVLASLIGTTGAAMLLIRPLLQANTKRTYTTHTLVFFIFLVANIGGSLTPLGDPPLFLGFLKGVDFFWTTTHLFLPWLFMCTSLLGIYFISESILFQKENFKHAPSPATPLRLVGQHNFLFIFGIVGIILLSGLWTTNLHITLFGIDITAPELLRIIGLLTLAWASWKVSCSTERHLSDFSWAPVFEVAKLFAGIFITIIPAIAILKAGHQGALSPLVALVSTNGEPNHAMYFWLTGILSSFLDNAPTYLVFFNMAGGDTAVLMTTGAKTLLAISAGAVFMGANTYIGNAPNFMVKSIAEQNNVSMPSFFGYMVWSGGILIPLFIVATFLFF